MPDARPAAVKRLPRGVRINNSERIRNGSTSSIRVSRAKFIVCDGFDTDGTAGEHAGDRCRSCDPGDLTEDRFLHIKGFSAFPA
jgi:hypothetical protein